MTALKWATDYFLKAHTGYWEFYGQVGQGSTDHNYWGRPEDMAMERPSMKIDDANPGKDGDCKTQQPITNSSNANPT